MNKKLLKSYAQLIVKSGVNLQKGQEVVINADLDQPEFIKMLVEECYKVGASKVEVYWDYPQISKINAKYKSQKVMNRIEKWELSRLEHYRDILPARIYIESADPDGLKGINQKKITKASIAKYPVIKPIRDQMENKYQWCIAGVPGKKWAKKVFPGEKVGKATELLWDSILNVSRAYGDPIKNWDEHNAFLKSKYDYLNSIRIKNLHYTNTLGTDITVGLNENGLFLGGGETTLNGVFYNPNIPSEEIFTSPCKGKADGIVFSSKPLSYRGEIIEDFWFKFKEGKVVDFGAKKGYSLLKQFVNMDEGSSYLGECALVPFESPINQSGILFYNTLYDENAVCHFALGAGFTNCIKDYENYTQEELHKMGVNDSMIHVDFMIGTDDLKIVAETFDNKEIIIFNNGTWAI